MISAWAAACAAPTPMRPRCVPRSTALSWCATRAGTNPLVVKAVGLDNHNGNPILSVADANRVLIENGATGFLDRTNVVFVR